MLTHNAIRQTMRRRRQSLGCGAQVRAAHQLSRYIQRSASYQASQHIAVYWAVNGEINLRPLIKKAWSQGKSCYLPILQEQRLSFVRYSPGTQMYRNRFGIPEPRSSDVIAAENLDMVLVPLVAFDQKYHRIGMGGGYYDRTFAPSSTTTPLNYSSHALRQKILNSRRRAFLMGVGHRCQKVKNIVPADWDVPMDDVLMA